MNFIARVFSVVLLWTAGCRAAEEPAPASVIQSAQDELTALVRNVKTRLESGPATAETLAAELKAFDVFVATRAEAEPEIAAQALLIKAALYLQVLEDTDRAGETLRRLKAEFPNTKPGESADMMLARLAAQQDNLRKQAALKVGEKFPDFEEKDLTGASLSVAQFKGKAVLVDFWATWCGPCVAELPNVLAAYAKYRDKGFEIIGISLDRDEDALKAFLAEHKMTWPQYFDGKAWDSALGRAYGVNSIPATYLLDREGRIVAKNLRGDALERELAKLLGE